VAKMLNVSSSYVRQLVRVDNADEEIKALLSAELIGISETLQLQSMGQTEKKVITEEIWQAKDDGELKSVKKEGLNRASNQKEKSVDEQIREDLEKIEKLVERIDRNIEKAEFDFTEMMGIIIDRLCLMRF